MFYCTSEQFRLRIRQLAFRSSSSRPWKRQVVVISSPNCILQNQIRPRHIIGGSRQVGDLAKFLSKIDPKRDKIFFFCECGENNFWTNLSQRRIRRENPQLWKLRKPLGFRGNYSSWEVQHGAIASKEVLNLNSLENAWPELLAEAQHQRNKVYYLYYQQQYLWNYSSSQNI